MFLLIVGSPLFSQSFFGSSANTLEISYPGLNINDEVATAVALTEVVNNTLLLSLLMEDPEVRTEILRELSRACTNLIYEAIEEIVALAIEIKPKITRMSHIERVYYLGYFQDIAVMMQYF